MDRVNTILVNQYVPGRIRHRIVASFSVVLDFEVSPSFVLSPTEVVDLVVSPFSLSSDLDPTVPSLFLTSPFDSAIAITSR